MESTNASRRLTRCRTLAEIDFINSSAFRQTQVSLQNRQQQLNRDQFGRLAIHDKEHAELKQFLKQIRKVDNSKCRSENDRGEKNVASSNKPDMTGRPTTRKHEKLSGVKRRSRSDGDDNLPSQMTGLSLKTSSGDRESSVSKATKSSAEGEAVKTGNFGVNVKSTSTIKPEKVTLSNEEKIRQIAVLAPNKIVSLRSPKDDVMIPSASEANTSSTQVNTKPIRTGFSSLPIDSSSSSEDESVFDGTEAKRRRQRRKVIRRQSKSLDAPSPPRTTSTNGICRNCCVKQYQFSDEKNLNVFIASQKSILKRRKSSSDVFSTKQLTPGQLVDIQTNRDRPSVFDKN